MKTIIIITLALFSLSFLTAFAADSTNEDVDPKLGMHKDYAKNCKRQECDPKVHGVNCALEGSSSTKCKSGPTLGDPAVKPAAEKAKI